MPSVELLIQNGNNLYQPIIVDEIILEQEINTCSTLTFKVLKDDIINFQEGNAVRLKVDDVNMFFGFVFTKVRNKEQIITVKCYDQLRYLKNKDTIIYSNKTTPELIRMISDNYKLQTGLLENTNYSITRVEDNKTLLDMIVNSLNDTLMHTKKKYILFDDFGKLTLKNIENMKLPLIITGDNTEDFEYATSIDSNTYNKVKLVYEDKETKKREVYIAQNTASQNEWGVLQYYEEVDSTKNIISKANTLLDLYNSKTRTLNIQSYIGDPRIKAGSVLVVYIPNIGDISISNLMVCKTVTHKITTDLHLIDIGLIGNYIFGE